ncbi:MAG: ABC transporter permease [bacterium]
MKIITIINKNIKYLIHNKFSTAIVIIGPLIIIIFAAFAFNNDQLYGLNIGIINQKENKLISKSFLEEIEKEGYSIINYNSTQKCINDMKKIKIHICIEERSNVIKFNVEPSRINLVHILLDIFSKKIGTITDEVKYELTSNLIKKISEINTYLKDSSNYFNQLVNNTNNMQNQLNKISNEIRNLEIEVNTKDININDIKNTSLNNQGNIVEFKNEINNKIDESINRLNEFDDLTNEIENEINIKQNDENLIKDYLNSAFNKYECENEDYIDLKQYYQNPDMLKNLIENKNPECSFVYTIKNSIVIAEDNLNDITNNIKDIQYEIRTTKRELNDIKTNSNQIANNMNNDIEELDSFFIELEDELENINNNLINIEKTKLELRNNIHEIEKELEENIIKLNEFNNNFHNLTSQLDEISKLRPNQILNPVINQIEGFDNKRSNIDYLFPTLIVFIIMFVGILLGNILISTERKSRAFFRNLISPTNELILPIGTYITALSILLIQVTIIFILAMFFLPISIYINPIELFLTLFIAISIFVSIGIILANLIKSEVTLIIISIIFCFIFLIFSSVLLPIEIIPPFFIFLIELNPFHIMLDIIGKQIINGILIKEMFFEILKSTIYLIILFSGAIYSFHKIKK